MWTAVQDRFTVPSAISHAERGGGNTLLAAALLLVALARVSAAAVVFTSDTTIGAGDLLYEGEDVTVQGCTLTISGHHEFAALRLVNGVVTHPPCTESAVYSVDLAVTGTVAVDAASSIDLSGRGYLPGRTVGNTAAGAASGRAGGSYGGRGGQEVGSAGIPNPVYGDYRAPNEPGSGGGAQHAGAGAGGGLASITADTLSLDGAILANGTPGTFDRPGGSGGGIDVRVGTLSGNGTFAATGGDSSGNAGAGGGG
ncbi:MAG: hypothetical protein JXR77_13825, partial [Lentisphaeria bacterium]|nr:hypothetical protein [Lentisphaeria bacterium]